MYRLIKYKYCGFSYLNFKLPLNYNNLGEPSPSRYLKKIKKITLRF